MGLPRLFYTLPELAEHWSKISGEEITESDLLHMAATGELIVSEEAVGTGTNVYWFGRGKGKLTGYYQLKPLDLKYFLPGNRSKNYQVIMRASQDGEDFACMGTWDGTENDLDLERTLIANFQSLVVLPGHEAEARKKHIDPRNDQDKRKQLFIGDPGEVPIVGQRKIAEHLSVTDRTVRNYIDNDVEFPWFYEGKKRCAYPSRLAKWRRAKVKKKK